MPDGVLWAAAAGVSTSGSQQQSAGASSVTSHALSSGPPPCHLVTLCCHLGDRPADAAKRPSRPSEPKSEAFGPGQRT